VLRDNLTLDKSNVLNLTSLRLGLRILYYRYLYRHDLSVHTDQLQVHNKYCHCLVPDAVNAALYTIFTSKPKRLILGTRALDYHCFAEESARRRIVVVRDITKTLSFYIIIL